MATMILHWKIVYFKNANPNKYILINILNIALDSIQVPFFNSEFGFW